MSATPPRDSQGSRRWSSSSSSIGSSSSESEGEELARRAFSGHDRFRRPPLPKSPSRLSADGSSAGDGYPGRAETIGLQSRRMERARSPLGWSSPPAAATPQALAPPLSPHSLPMPFPTAAASGLMSSMRWEDAPPPVAVAMGGDERRWRQEVETAVETSSEDEEEEQPLPPAWVEQLRQPEPFRDRRPSEPTASYPVAGEVCDCPSPP